MWGRCEYYPLLVPIKKALMSLTGDAKAKKCKSSLSEQLKASSVRTEDEAKAASPPPPPPLVVDHKQLLVTYLFLQQICMATKPICLNKEWATSRHMRFK